MIFARQVSRVWGMSVLMTGRLGMLLLLAVPAFAQTKGIGDISFSVPEGYTYEFKPGDDHATMGFIAGQTFCVVVIYRAMPSSGNAEGDFKAIWTRLLSKSAGPGLPNPIYDFQSQVGYQGKQSGSPSVDGRTYLWLYTLESGQGVIPIVVLTTGRVMFDQQQAVVKRFAEGVRQGPVEAQAAKTTIHVADLAGEWRHGASSVADYVNRSTGAFSSTSTVFYGETYEIAADGRYTYRFQGRANNHTVREGSSGVVEMGGEFVVFRDIPGTRVRKYRFINYQPAIGGSTVLTLLPSDYPVNSSNLGLYGEQWVRAATGK
ncbi:MAG: hypothetical protein ABI823_00095 [Bryobacteraceae bacterium]